MASKADNKKSDTKKTTKKVEAKTTKKEPVKKEVVKKTTTKKVVPKKVEEKVESKSTVKKVETKKASTKKEVSKEEKKNNFFKMTKSDIVAIIILIIFIIGMIFSPEVYLISTGKFNQGSEEDNKLVKSILGDEAEERFHVYFDWFNVVHEIGHGIIHNNSKAGTFKGYEEEQLVNDFAAAFWRYYGEESKLMMVKETADIALSNLKMPVDDQSQYMEYAKENWNKKAFNTFNNYGFFQFSCVKSSLEKDKTLEEVLKEMGVTDFKVQEAKTLIFKDINENTSEEVIKEVLKTLDTWEIDLPTVYHMYSKNPNNHSIRFIKDFYGIIGLIFEKME